MAFELLSKPIKKYIYDQGWPSLRPIQKAAIPHIVNRTATNYILVSKTASGKTEAAFLPALSVSNFNRPGVQILYISPLIALINDQFFRLSKLCEYLEIPVTRWHGEAKQSSKRKLLESPKGVLLITPESLEAMFVNSPENIKHLFINTEYIIVDEVHSFVGADRGVQLQSIINRIQQEVNRRISIIGLSATVSDYEEVKKFTGDANNTKVLVDRKRNDIEAKFKYYESKTTELSDELVASLYEETKSDKVLIFPNSRGRVEEIAVKLKRISESSEGHQYYFSHHSSINRELREYIEKFAKTNKRYDFCIVCTSTLELGIDIGSIDEVVQVDATFSVSSLVQRVGRSGRMDGAKSKLVLYSTNPWKLIQSMAIWSLYTQGVLEPQQNRFRAFDILVHQILSIVKSTSGIEENKLKEKLASNSTFQGISPNELDTIFTYLLEHDLLEQVGNEYILGLTAERIVNNKEFYSVFITKKEFKVVFGTKVIGELPLTPQLRKGSRIYLAARIWEIGSVDYHRCVVHVEPAKDGKKPKFGGEMGVVSALVREEMLQLLQTKEEFKELDIHAKSIYNELRDVFSAYKLKNFKTERPVVRNEFGYVIYTFTSDKIQHTLGALLEHSGFDIEINDVSIKYDFKYGEFSSIVTKVNSFQTEVDLIVENNLKQNPGLLDSFKYAKYLPLNFQIELIKERHFDFTGAFKYLDECTFVEFE